MDPYKVWVDKSEELWKERAVKMDKTLIENIVLQLDQSFGHLDFWWLSKKWKNITYEEFAKRVIRMVRDYDEMSGQIDLMVHEMKVRDGTRGSQEQEEK